MIMYTVGCKFSRYGRNSHIWLYEPSPCSELKTVNQSSCMTLWPMMMHRNVTKFSYRRFSGWGHIVQINIHWNSEPFLNSCDLDLDHNRVIRSFHKTIQLMCAIKPKFSCKRISSSEAFTVTLTLTLKTAYPSFRKIILLIMMHQHAITKFSSN